MKARRQSVILDLVQREPVRNQEQLRKRLRA
jgi:arginine repressor